MISGRFIPKGSALDMEPVPAMLDDKQSLIRIMIAVNKIVQSIPILIQLFMEELINGYC